MKRTDLGTANKAVPIRACVQTQHEWKNQSVIGIKKMGVFLVTIGIKMESQIPF